MLASPNTQQSKANFKSLDLSLLTLIRDPVKDRVVSTALTLVKAALNPVYNDLKVYTLAINTPKRKLLC
jgi:hypothetical protein